MSNVFEAPIPQNIVVAPLGNKRNPNGQYVVILFGPPKISWNNQVTGGVAVNIENIQREDENGYSLIKLSINPNSGGALQGQLELTAPGYDPRSIPITQMAGAVFLDQIYQLITSPMIMEFAIALKYIAEQIQKAPPEAQPALIIAVNTGIELVADMIDVARLSLAPQIPEPEIPFAIPKDEKWRDVNASEALTTNYIQRQKLILAAYFDETVVQE